MMNNDYLVISLSAGAPPAVGRAAVRTWPSRGGEGRGADGGCERRNTTPSVCYLAKSAINPNFI